MKKWNLILFLSLFSVVSFGQQENTLLWKIEGNGLKKPSYLFGTMHILCADDAELGKNLRAAIAQSDNVYLEVDMSNLMEMADAMSKMKMKGDTTLETLLTKVEFQKIKDYFENENTLLPFAMINTYKPLLAASLLEQKAMPCEKTAMMEQLIMQEAKKNDKKIKGLETMSYQASVLDSIPYKLQAQQLFEYIAKSDKKDESDRQMKEMIEVYKKQDLNALGKMMIEEDAGMSAFMDILLYNRNRNWVNKLNTLLPEKSLVIAVGAGHLPGENGVINLLKKEGYTVTPVQNQYSNKLDTNISADAIKPI